VARVAAKNRDEYLRRRRTDLLRAAGRVLSERGFEQTTMASIAEAAGVSKGTLYNYFSSKEEVLAAVLTERTVLLEEALDHTALSPRRALETVAHVFLRESMDLHPEVARLVLVESPRFPAVARLVFERLMVLGGLAMSRFLDEEARAGRLRRPRDPSLTTLAFFGMLQAYMQSQEIMSGKAVMPIDRRQFVEEIVDIFLNGVSPEPESGTDPRPAALHSIPWPQESHTTHSN